MTAPENPVGVAPEGGPTARWRLSPAQTLLLILILAALVRVWGLQFGLPLVLARPDEQLIAGKAIEFFQKGTLNPRFFDYPTLYLYLLAGLYYLYFALGWVAGWFQSFADFLASFPTHWVPFFLIGRVVGAVSGTATVWLVYALARRLLDHRAAVVAALFSSLAFLHVRDSHYATTDVPMTFFTVAAMLFIVRAHQSGHRRDAVLAGVFAGLAMATKYNALMLVAPMLASASVRVWDAPGRRGRALVEANLHWMVGAMAMAFFIGSPYVFLDFGKFRYDMKWLRWSMQRGMTPPELLGIGWTYHVGVSLRYGLGLPLLVTSLAGLVAMSIRRPRAALILCAFPVAFYTATGASYNVFVRYMVPIVPFLCVTAAFLVVSVGEWLTRRPARWMRVPLPVADGVLAVSVLIVWPSAASVMAFDRLLTIPDSRLLAGAWMREHAPPGSVIYYAGAVYGHLQLEDRRPFKYVYWRWDRDASQFRNQRDRWTDDWPDWVVVHESPLPYSHVPERVEGKLRSDYVLAHVEQAVDSDDPRNVYDLQDGFFLPFAGFNDIHRPGPNILIYRRHR